MLFDTVISVEIYDDADESILEECKELCTNYDNMFSNTNPDSEISKINQAGGEPVEVSDETITLIQTGIDYGELSGGAFDITISPVADLWDFKTDTPSLPDASALEEALTHVNYKNIQIDGNYVSLSDPEAAIDVGGIAKGYIADRLKEYLQSQGIEHAMINLGGNVLAMGAKLDGSDYNIGIQDPFDSEGNPITAVQIADQTVVTSGTYERFFKIDDTIYHHILNPSTGYPYENGLSSVTIITDSSLEADALSTTCFALGYEDGMNLINQLDGVDAIFITTDEEVHYSDDFTNHS
jgi:thiamine biosynthesis lipoprotein